MKNTIYLLMIFMLLSSCYDDKGNYDYITVNEVDVQLPSSFGLRLGDTTLVIRPEISQSMRDGYKYLQFYWQHSTVNFASVVAKEADTLSLADTVALHIDPDDKNLKYEHYLRLNIYDEKNDILYPYQTKVSIVKPFNGAWMVLHKQEGETRLGSVEYIDGKPLVTKDAYYEMTGKKLHGEPLCLGCHEGVVTTYWRAGNYVYNGFSVVTDDPDEAGIYTQWKKFEKNDSLSRMVAPAYREMINYQGITQYGSNASASVCLSDGVLYQGGHGLKLYKAPINNNVKGEVYLSQAASVGFISMYYDKIGRRFLNYYYYNNIHSIDPLIFNEAGNQETLNPIPARPTNVQYGIVDPNAIPLGQEVIYIGHGYQYGPSMTGAGNRMYCYAYALGDNNKSYVWEFRSYGIISSSDVAFSGYYEIDTPAGIDENTCFASSMAYNGILFYALGNKIYRLDFTASGGMASVLYAHPDGGNVSKMKFAKSGAVNSSLDYPGGTWHPNRTLAVVLDKNDGTSDLVVLNLSTSGKAENVSQYKGDFGKIKDIVFL